MPADAPVMPSIFARQAAGCADASRVADMAAAMWQRIGMALSPIIGKSGVDALFKRSIHLTLGANPCLGAVFEDNALADGLAKLQAVLAQQTSATTAVSVNVALLKNFQELLTSLIGLSLTQRLLRPVWDQPSSGQAEQETAP